MTSTATATPDNDGLPVGLLVRHADLVFVVRVGARETAASLTPQMALELARDLICAGLAHAEARAMQRMNADAVAAGLIAKTSSSH